MKKFLAALSTLIVGIAPAIGVISCARPDGYGQQVADDSSIDKVYRQKYNWQSGPSSEAKKLNNNLSNSFITSFDGSAESTYSAYSINKGWQNPTFYGDIDNFLKTSDNKFIPSGWRNDNISFQNILIFKKNVKSYKNITLSVKDVTKVKGKELDEKQKLVGTVQFEKYMLTNKHGTTELDGSILDERQYVPDALMGNSLDTLSQKVSVDGMKTVKDVYFDVWNSWINLKSSADTYVGNHDLEILISFDYAGDSKRHQYIKQQKANVKKYSFSRQEFDENSDGNIDWRDKFGLSSSTFPVNGLANWDNDIYSKDINVNIAQKLGTNEWTSDQLKPLIAGKKPTFKTVYLSKGSDLTVKSDEEGLLTFSTNTPNLNFDAFIEVRIEDKLIATLSVYFNEFGQPTYAFIYNKEDSLKTVDGKDIKNPDDVIDINGDGVKDSKDWDVDGDGIYTREDWNSSDAWKKDSSGKQVQVFDEIGPSPNYADYVRRTPMYWSDMDKDIAPLQSTNSLYLTGTGSHKQLIQYTGNLIDDSYSSKFNGSKSGPADDYEKALADANSSSSNFVKFITPKKGHEWKWNFDFTNLDKYMRLAAANNIPEVMINPVDDGGFSFWYLKGKDAKLGPQRDMLTKSSLSLINSASGKISDTGKAYTTYVVKELVKQLSAHLANDVYNNPIYQTANGSGHVRVYFTFDEENENSIDYVMSMVKSNSVAGGEIYSSCYLGYRSDIEHKKFDGDDTVRDLNDENMDQIIFQFRMIANNANNSDLMSIRQKFVERAKKGKTTLFYMTKDGYPGGYCQSDLSSEYWQMFFNYRMGTNGQGRWAWDDIYSDYYNSSVIDWQRHEKRVSGQGFLIYGGSDSKGAYISTRVLAYARAVDYVYKMKQILYNRAAFSMQDKIQMGLALQSVGLATLKFNNNDWKYNILNSVAPSDFGMITDGDSSTVSEQIYKIISYIDSL